jgi:hypothetical protein
MQGIVQRYNCWASCFYTQYRRFVTSSPVSPYLYYALNVTRTHFPKLAYQNNFEPEYTRPLVKYNTAIVLSIVAFTLYASRKAVAEEEAKTAGNQ